MVSYWIVQAQVPLWKRVLWEHNVWFTWDSLHDLDKLNVTISERAIDGYSTLSRVLCLLLTGFNPALYKRDVFS